jgi:hypothetical protein
MLSVAIMPVRFFGTDFAGLIEQPSFTFLAALYRAFPAFLHAQREMHVFQHEVDRPGPKPEPEPAEDSAGDPESGLSAGRSERFRGNGKRMWDHAELQKRQTGIGQMMETKGISGMQKERSDRRSGLKSTYSLLTPFFVTADVFR